MEHRDTLFIALSFGALARNLRHSKYQHLHRSTAVSKLYQGKASCCHRCPWICSDLMYSMLFLVKSSVTSGVRMGPALMKTKPFLFFLLNISFIYISSVIPFPGFPSANPHPPFSSACFYECSPQPTPHTLPPPHPGIPLHWVIKPSQDQGPLLPLMPDNAILCYMCSWSHGSLHSMCTR